LSDLWGTNGFVLPPVVVDGGQKQLKVKTILITKTMLLGIITALIGGGKEKKPDSVSTILVEFVVSVKPN
jgi:hypothetical protein